MKNMDAMILTSVADILRAGEQPERDLILVFFADEENGGVEGSHLVVTQHPEWFAGATEAISEVGGYSISVGDRRAYLLQVGEKALIWIRLRARGRAGHGSRVHPDNAVTRLAEAVAALGRTEWPVRLTDDHGDAARRPEGPQRAPMTTTPTRWPMSTGAAAGFIRSTLRTTTNPTGLTAGYKHNVIPDVAEALIDVRTLPGTEDAALADIRRIVGDDVEIEIVVRDIGLEVPFEGELVDAMVAALGRARPRRPRHPVPDGRRHRQQGARRASASPATASRRCGFRPISTSPVCSMASTSACRIDALVFGQRVLTDLLRTLLTPRTPRARHPIDAARTVASAPKGAAMQFIEAIILGLVQGLTEFLPISSSAHLRILGEFLPAAQDPGAAFTAITQLGTEAAVARVLLARHRADHHGLVPGAGRQDPAQRPRRARWAG